MTPAILDQVPWAATLPTAAAMFSTDKPRWIGLGKEAKPVDDGKHPASS